MPGLSRQKEEMKYPRQRSMWAHAERDEKKFAANELCTDSFRQNSTSLRSAPTASCKDSMRLRLAGAFRKGGIDSGFQGEHNQKKSCHKQGKS